MTKWRLVAYRIIRRRDHQGIPTTNRAELERLQHLMNQDNTKLVYEIEEVKE